MFRYFELDFLDKNSEIVDAKLSKATLEKLDLSSSTEYEFIRIINNSYNNLYDMGPFVCWAFLMQSKIIFEYLNVKCKDDINFKKYKSMDLFSGDAGKVGREKLHQQLCELYNVVDWSKFFCGMNFLSEEILEEVCFYENILMSLANKNELTIKILDNFIEKGVNLNSIMYGETLLGVLCSFEKVDLELIEHIVARGGNLNIADSDGNTPLHIACSRFGILEGGRLYNKSSNKQLIKLLISNGADVNVVNNASKNNPLMEFIDGRGYTKDLDIVRILLEAGTDVESTDVSGDNVLFLDIEAGCVHEEFIRLLIKFGLSVNSTNRNKDNLLMYLLRHKPVNMNGLCTILKFDIDLECKDVFGGSALGMACSSGEVEATRLLLKNGAKADNENGFGESFLINSLNKESCNVEIASLLLENGADIESRDTLGKTALCTLCASKKANLGAVEFLLRRGASIRAVDNSGWTPLMHACRATRVNRNLINLLLLFGADKSINLKNRNFDTALSILCTNKGSIVSIVKLFVELGADITALNGNGKTALQIYKKSNCKHSKTILKILGEF